MNKVPPSFAALSRLGGLDPVSMAMGVAFALMWSSAFTSAKFVVADAPPLLALALRFALSGVLACAVAAALGQSARLSRRQWLMVAVFGVCQNGLYLGLNFVAMTRIEGGLAAIIASLLPLLVAAGAWLSQGERPARLGLLGLALGFAGVAVVMGGRLSGGSDALGIALCIVGAGALAVATLVVRSASSGGNLLMVVGLQMLAGALVLAPVAMVFESIDDVRWTLRLGLAFAYTTLVPGVIATLVWFTLVGRIGPTRASAFHFLNPCFGIGIAWLLLGEPLGLVDLLGVTVATAGILLVQLSRRPA